MRGFGEVDRPISADVEIVETSKLHAVRFGSKNFYLSRFIHRQQSLDRICNDQISLAIENQSEGRPPVLAKTRG